jgi:4-hydroxybenzoate polyprenyltransferase
MMLLHAIPAILLTMTAFVLNDLYDLEKDRKADRWDKPLVSGRVCLATCWAFAVVLVLATTEFFCSRSILVLHYCGRSLRRQSLFVRRPKTASLATALLCCTPLAYGSQVAHDPVSELKYVAFITFIVGRELLMDVIHYSGDIHAGLCTLVAY